MTGKRKSDAQNVSEFVAAARRAGDPRVEEYEAGRRAARSAAAKRGAATRKTKTDAKKLPMRSMRSTRRTSSAPVSGTPRFRDPIPATVRASRPMSTPTVRIPRAPGPARTPHTPTLTPPAVRVPATVGKARRGGLSVSQRDAVQAGHAVANRGQANQLMGGKPSRVGSAVAGGASGAATGATLGSVVPGVGTAVGAGVGAAVGTAGGAISGGRRVREYKRATAAAPGARKALVAEFTVCMLVVALSPLTDRRKTDPPAAWMKRMVALMAVFLILGLLSAIGRGPARVAASFGGLVALVLAVSERDLFVKIGDIFGGVPQDATLLPVRTPIDPSQPAPGGVFS